MGEGLRRSGFFSWRCNGLTSGLVFTGALLVVFVAGVALGVVSIVVVLNFKDKR